MSLYVSLSMGLSSIGYHHICLKYGFVCLDVALDVPICVFQVWFYVALGVTICVLSMGFVYLYVALGVAYVS